MGISYDKLRDILFDRKIKLGELKEGTKLSNEVLAKINKDEHMNTESLERIARYLEVNIGDIVELK